MFPIAKLAGRRVSLDPSGSYLLHEYNDMCTVSRYLYVTGEFQLSFLHAKFSPCRIATLHANVQCACPCLGLARPLPTSLLPPPPPTTHCSHHHSALSDQQNPYGVENHHAAIFKGSVFSAVPPYHRAPNDCQDADEGARVRGCEAGLTVLILASIMAAQELVSKNLCDHTC
jgi:hypothetical protein